MFFQVDLKAILSNKLLSVGNCNVCSGICVFGVFLPTWIIILFIVLILLIVVFRNAYKNFKEQEGSDVIVL